MCVLGLELGGDSESFCCCCVVDCGSDGASICLLSSFLLRDERANVAIEPASNPTAKAVPWPDNLSFILLAGVEQRSFPS